MKRRESELAIRETNVMEKMVWMNLYLLSMVVMTTYSLTATNEAEERKPWR